MSVCRIHVTLSERKSVLISTTNLFASVAQAIRERSVKVTYTQVNHYYLFEKNIMNILKTEFIFEI